jgi:hypothetical protein
MLTLNPAKPIRRRKNHHDEDDEPCCSACARGNPCESDCPSQPQDNPTGGTVALLLGGGLAAFGVGYLIYQARHKAPYGQRVPPEVALQGMLSDGEILGASPYIVGDVMQPIALAISPAPSGYSQVEEIVVRAPGTLNEAPQQLRNVDFGSGVEGVPNEMMWEGRLLDGTVVQGVAPANADKAVASLVTNVSGDTARFLYEAALGIISKTGADWDNGGQRDAMTIQILQAVAPGVDWSQGLRPYAVGSDPYRFWIASQLIGTVAEQSLMNKRAQAQAQGLG